MPQIAQDIANTLVLYSELAAFAFNSLFLFRISMLCLETPEYYIGDFKFNLHFLKNRKIYPFNWVCEQKTNAKYAKYEILVKRATSNLKPT